jgi:uncharacterized protein YdaU (DUF1376 family)
MVLKKRRGRKLMHYTKFGFKDYRHDTRGLDPAAHGIYLLLLFEFMEREKPLPSDMDDLCCLCEARTTKEQEIVKKVLKKFWLRLEDGWIQKLAFIQVLNYKAGAVVKKSNAQKISGQSKQKLATGIAKRTLGEILAKCERTGSEPLADWYKITSESLASLINHKSVISNQESVIKNQEPRPLSGGERTSSDWANFLHPIFSGRRDGEMECKNVIRQDIDTGTDPAEIERNVRLIVSYIEKAPGGWANAFIGNGRNFWHDRKWRNPEAFAMRWDEQKKKKGAASDDSGITVPVTPFSDEPDGWKVVWPDLFDGEPPARWIDILLSDRKAITAAALEWQKNKAEGEES